jgi:hypothetical protein
VRRGTDGSSRRPEDLKPHLEADPFKLYQLIWRRFDPTRMGPEAMSLLLGVQDFVNEVPAQIEQLLAE